MTEIKMVTVTSEDSLGWGRQKLKRRALELAFTAEQHGDDMDVRHQSAMISLAQVYATLALAETLP